MAFLIKDETANVNVIYIDNSGQLGLMGSANSGQALTFAGNGVITTSAYLASLIAPPGTPSPLAGTVVVPISSSADVAYTVPQIPTVMADVDPDAVTTTKATFSNPSSVATASYNYKIW